MTRKKKKINIGEKKSKGQQKRIIKRVSFVVTNRKEIETVNNQKEEVIE